MMLIECLKSYFANGKVTWNGIEIASQQLQSVFSYSDKKNFHQKLSVQTGIDLKEIETFVCRSSSIITSNDSFMTNGHPLEYKHILHADESMNDSKLLNFSSAQMLISSLLQVDTELLLKTLPMLVFCDGFSNKNNIYLLHIHFKANDSLSYKQMKKSDDNAVVVRAVSCEGPLSKEVWELTHGQKFYSKLAFPFHMLSDDGSLPLNFSLSSKSFQHYELLSENNEALWIDQHTNVSSISVGVSCFKVDKLFGIDSSNISSVNVNVTPIPGLCSSPAYILFGDLSILTGLLEGFGDEGQVKWSEQEDVCESENFSNKLWENLQQVITASNETSPGIDENSEREDAEQFVTLLAPRDELDFTEKIWNVLKMVQSFQDLLTGLELILNAIEQNNVGQFWLHEDADSYLAELIKQSYEGKFERPCLVGLLPLQILIEIGIDKLRRDYVHFFTSHCLCTSARLDELMCVNPESNVGKRLKSKITGISKLHHVLELSVYLNTFLQLSMVVIRKVIKTALQDYMTCDIDFTKTYSFPVSYNDVKTQLETTVPSLWKIDVRGSNENGKCNGSACWSTNSPFDCFISSISTQSVLENSSLDAEEITSNVYYYMTTVTESLVPLSMNN